MQQRLMSNGVSSCETRVRTVLRIRLGNEKLAQSLLEAIRVDDRTAPPSLGISEAVDNGDLVITVEACAEPKRIGSVRNTVEEIVEFAYAALKAIEASQR